MHVRSAGRTMTIKQAIHDEKIGGDFIPQMSASEYKMFQLKLSRWIVNKQAKTKHYF